MMNAYAIGRQFFSQPWAVIPETLQMMREVIEARINGLTIEPDTYAAPVTRSFSSSGAVAVLPLLGVMTPRAGLFQQLFGGVSTQQWTSQLNAMIADPMISAIVLDVDSVGGNVGMITEAAAAMRAGRKKKKIYAVANGMMASAAYWIGSQASEIIITPSGRAGSIGVFAEHTDLSQAADSAGIRTTLISAGKFKTEGNPFEPLTDEATAELQRSVDRIYDRFVSDVAAGRGVRAAKVERDFGQGRLLDAEDALSAGLVDRIATLDETIAIAARGGGIVSRFAADESGSVDFEAVEELDQIEASEDEHESGSEIEAIEKARAKATALHLKSSVM